MGKKQILITGITGFAGYHLAEYLLSLGHDQIAGTYLSETSLETFASLKNRLGLHQVDLTDWQKVQETVSSIRPAIIYHLAALPSPRESFQEPKLYLQNNINSELHILETLIKHNLKETKMLVVSTAEVYGRVQAENLPLNEEAPLRPVSPYGVSKIAQDFLGLQYFLAYNLPVVRVRPFNHLGPRLSDKFAPSAFAKKIAQIEKGIIPPLLTVGNLESKRDFTDVKDVVRAYVLLMEKGEAGEVYNLGSGKSYKIREVLDILLSLTKVSLEVKEDPLLLRPNDIPDLRCNYSKITRATGWQPAISLKDSLKTLLDYWRSVV